MIKQLCMKRIYGKIRLEISTKSSALAYLSPLWRHASLLKTGIVALHIPSRRVREREERRQVRITVWPVIAGRVICRYRNRVYGINNHHKQFRDSFFLKSKSQVSPITISALAPRWRLPRALHCDARYCLTAGIVALHIPPSGATTTVSRQNSKTEVKL